MNKRYRENNDLTKLVEKIGWDTFKEIFEKVDTVGVDEFKLLDNPIYVMKPFLEIVLDFDKHKYIFLDLKKLEEFTGQHIYTGLRIKSILKGVTEEFVPPCIWWRKGWREFDGQHCIVFHRKDWRDNFEWLKTRSEFLAFDNLESIKEEYKNAFELKPIEFTIYKLKKEL